MPRPSLVSSASTLALLSVLSLPQAAAAQSACTPSAPSDGDYILCSGVGEGIVDGGLDDATITVLAGTGILGPVQGFVFDDNVTLNNEGTILGMGDHAVQGDNGVSIINRGTIVGSGDGVNIDNDGVVVNFGLIIGADDGVQLEENAFVINQEGGIIRGGDEGVNINTDDATLINLGLIEAVDDAVNAGENAFIVNQGTIRSVGDQDGIDLDSGQIYNTGAIIAMGAEDGIDFDPSVNDSFIVNEGLIEGTIAINTDPGDTGAQTVRNSGTLRGRGGVAVNLGGGDDVLRLYTGSRVFGLIEMGDGNDTVEVNAITAGVLRFGSLPETLTYMGPGVLVGSTLTLIDPAPLAAPDRMLRDAAGGLAGVALDRAQGDASWAAVFGGRATHEGRGGYQGFELRTGGLAMGRRTDGAVSGFAGYTQASAAMADGEHTLEQSALLFGVTHVTPFGDGGQLGFVGFGGFTDTNLRSPAWRSGDGDFSGLVLGARFRLTTMLGASGLDLGVQGDVLHHRTQGYTLSGLGGTLAAHGATAYGLRVDLGLSRAIGGGTLRPYVFGAARAGAQEAMTFIVPGGSTTFAPAEVLDDSGLGLGLSYRAALAGGALSAGVEWQRINGHDEDALRAQLDFRVSF